MDTLVANDSLEAGSEYCAAGNREVECAPMNHMARSIATDAEMWQRLIRTTTNNYNCTMKELPINVQYI